MVGSGLLSDMGFLMKHFSVNTAFNVRLKPLLKRLFLKKNYFVESNQEILRYLRLDLYDVIEKYKHKWGGVETISSDAPIWVCWWQGEDQMPPIIKACYKRLLKYSNGHPVNLITEANVRHYVEFSDHIWNRFYAKDLGITQLSDILRVSLLSKYGGLWIDATFWVTGPIEINSFPIYTLKQKDKSDSLVSNYRWIGGLIGGNKSNPLFHFLQDCFNHYWCRHDALIHYFLLDYFLEIAYSEYPLVKQMIDDMPYRSPNLHIMKKIFDSTYDEKVMNELLAANPFLSLTWKKPFKEYTSDGSFTYFHKFISE